MGQVLTSRRLDELPVARWSLQAKPKAKRFNLRPACLAEPYFLVLRKGKY